MQPVHLTIHIPVVGYHVDRKRSFPMISSDYDMFLLYAGLVKARRPHRTVVNLPGRKKAGVLDVEIRVPFDVFDDWALLPTKEEPAEAAG